MSVLREWTDVETAWVAGLLEGEGCFFNHKGRLGIKLQMTDKDVVERAAELIGRSVIFVPARREGWQDTHQVRVSGADAITLGKRLLPWMGERRRAKLEEFI